MLGFDNVTYLSLQFKFILSERLSPQQIENSQEQSSKIGMSTFLEFINIVSIIIYNFIEFIIYFFSNSFPRYKHGTLIRTGATCKKIAL